jgi:hypothetical protein
MADAGIARATFEAENNVLQLDSADELFRYDEAAQRQVDSLKLWRSDPRYFKQCVPLDTLRHACMCADRALCVTRRAARGLVTLWPCLLTLLAPRAASASPRSRW